jgi:PTH1 family peptidyl-tRNA hydrolase
VVFHDELTDVARTLDEGESDDKPARGEKGAPDASLAPPERTAKGQPLHPAGERAGKRATALAENLRNWLASRRQKD